MSEQMPDHQQSLQVQVSRGGTTREFLSAFEFAKWLEEEKQRWEWLANTRSVSPSLKPVLIAQFNWLAAEAARLIQLPRDNESEARLTATSTAAAMSDLVRDGRLLLSDDPRGAFVLAIADKQPIVAAFALAQFIGVDTPPSDSQTARFEGRVRAVAFSLGVPDSAEATKKVFDTLSAEFRSGIDAHKAGASESSQKFESLLSEIRKQQQAQQQANENQLNAVKAAGDELNAKQTKEFESLKQSFQEFMRLKAPVEYWRRSSKWHRTIAAVFGLTSLAWGFFVGFQLVEYASLWLAKHKPAQSGAGVAGVIQESTPTPWELGLLLFLVTLAIWLLRMLVKLMLSNLHQGADAAARATMTEAYLALISEGKAISDQDRILVLSTLFRPMATGLIKDDGMPPSLTELLSRVVGGSGKA